MDTVTKENLIGVNLERVHSNCPLKFLTATSVIGDKAYNHKNEHMGTIEDIMLDVNSGKVE